jgi:hypothetical protein
MLSSPMARIYIGDACFEPSLTHARRIAEQFGVDLNDVYEALQRLRGGTDSGPWLLGPGSDRGLKVTAVSRSDGGFGTASLADVRQCDVDEVTAQASQGGLAGLSRKQQIVVAVVLIAAVYSVLPPGVRSRILEDATLAAAVAAVLDLLGRS